MDVNEAVRELRRRLGQSQRDFAARIGVSVRSVARYEGIQEPEQPALMRLESLASREGHADIAAVFLADLEQRLKAQNFDLEEAKLLRQSLRSSLQSGRPATKKVLVEVLRTALEIARRLPDDPEPEETES